MKASIFLLAFIACLSLIATLVGIFFAGNELRLGVQATGTVYASGILFFTAQFGFLKLIWIGWIQRKFSMMKAYVYVATPALLYTAVFFFVRYLGQVL